MEKFVVCIDDSKMIPPHPKKGEIYTYNGLSEMDSRFMHLKEFTHKSNLFKGQIVSYRILCFRPVDLSFGIEKCESIERQPVKQLA